MRKLYEEEVSKENYFISFYQLVLEKKLDRVVKMAFLSEEERINYPNEYPYLYYHDLFKDNAPDDVLDNLLESEEYKSFAMLLLKKLMTHMDSLNPLATEENIAKRQENYLELMKHPIINYSPNPAYKVSPLEAFLSITYSTVIGKQEVDRDFSWLIMQSSPIIEDILSVVTTSISINPEKYSIAIIGNKIEEYDPTIEPTITGRNDEIKNQLIITTEDKRINIPTFIHELSHKMMHLLYNDGDPYDDKSKDNYHQAIQKTLLNIQHFIKDSFNLELENQNDSFKMGEVLFSMLFPQYLQSESIQMFISILEKQNISIDNQFSWLGGYSPLEKVLLHLKFELADILVDSGAVINHNIIYLAVSINNIDMLNWALNKNQEINLNFRNDDGMTALDYANDPQIIKALIAAGSVPYSSNYEYICSINHNFQELTEVPIITEEQLSAFGTILLVYAGSYTRDEEDGEFIVRFPEIIAAGLYKDEIIDIVEPMAKYWQEVISSATVAYQDEYDISGICLGGLDYINFI